MERVSSEIEARIHRRAHGSSAVCDERGIERRGSGGGVRSVRAAAARAVRGAVSAGLRTLTSGARRRPARRWTPQWESAALARRSSRCTARETRADAPARAPAIEITREQ
eukprot:2728125-Pleurochrysis_carterae.AAC.2